MKAACSLPITDTLRKGVVITIRALRPLGSRMDLGDE